MQITNVAVIGGPAAAKIILERAVTGHHKKMRGAEVAPWGQVPTCAGCGA